MESKGIDPAQFRSTQREQWNIAASGWRKWSELIDTAAELSASAWSSSRPSSPGAGSSTSPRATVSRR